MHIIGNGVDIIDNIRIKKAIIKPNFIKRIYSNSEIRDSKKNRNKTSFFAKRFAAKEAFVKALGTGFRDEINFNDISIVNNNAGKPSLKISKKIKKIIKKKYKTKNFKIFLSLSDEKKYSVAYVIIQRF